MTITLKRTPRGAVYDYTNDCLNPSFENNTTGWDYLWFGTGGAGTNDRYTGSGLPAGGSAIRKTWTTASNGVPGESGFRYPNVPWYFNYIRFITCKVIINGVAAQNARIRVKYFDANNVQVGIENSQLTPLVAGVTKELTGFFHGAPNCVRGDVYIIIDETGQAMPVNSQFFADAVLISTYLDPANPGTGSLYFDGSTAAYGDFTFAWEGAVGNSRSYRYHPDPSTLIYPEQLADRYQYQQLGRNTIHTLMDGSGAATLMQGTRRSGTLKLLFETRAAAVACAEKHRGVGSWRFDDDENPELGMTYAVTGGQAVQVYQDDTRSFWTVEVPFSELG